MTMIVFMLNLNTRFNALMSGGIALPGQGWKSAGVAKLWLAIILWLLPLSLLLLPEVSHAARNGKTWGLTPLLGINRPQLKLLNHGEFIAGLPGRGRLTTQSTGENIDFDFIINNRLPAIDRGTNGGLEFQLLVSKKSALLFGFSVWEGTARSRVATAIPFQGVLTPTIYQRTGRISYFEYYLGWRHDFYHRPRKFNLYTKFILRELFDIDYKEDFSFDFKNDGNTSFKRLVVIESQATGALMFELGVGFEYFLYDWISIGMDAGYSFSNRRFTLGDANKKDDFQADDNLQFKLPSILDSNGKLRYLKNAAPFDTDPSYNQKNYRDLKLSFTGWRSFLRFNFYF